MRNQVYPQEELLELFLEPDELEAFDPELADAVWESEAGRSRRFPLRRTPYSRRPVRPRRPLPGRSRFGARRPRPGRPRWQVRRRPAMVIHEPVAAEPVAQGSEYIRWVQDTLNRAMNLSLPVDGIMGPETRSAIRDFQRREGLAVNGIAGPETKRALMAAASGGAPPAGTGEMADGELLSGIGAAFSRFADALGGATGSRIIDLTAKSNKGVRKGTRNPKKVYALVLHQMACCFQVKDPLKRFLSLKAHFAILPDGRILQLHPITELIYASHGFNNGSVAVEFAGNFPSVKGKWWKGEKYGRNRVTPAQIEAGRYLVRYLIRTMGLTHILAHRQSSGQRENDPGPDIWYHVGQWAVDNLGLKDGGPGFKVGTGNPIPDLWRTWGRAKPQPELEAADSEDLEAEDSQYEGPMLESYDEELAEETWEGEVNRGSRDYIRWVQQSLNKILGLRLAVDGIIGSQTRSAIRSFQRREGLAVDGVVGSQTERALMAAGAKPPPGSGTSPGIEGTTAPSSASGAPQGPFGTLTVTVPGRRQFIYKFTPEDVLWTARFIVGEAGGKDNLENRAIIWAMFNRYAFFTHTVFPTFHAFLRRYSTTLQPVLQSPGAARRHMHRPEFVRTGGYYPNTNIPRGQLERHLKLQATPWHKLPQSARSLAESALRGQISNPGISNASEFANTAVYFKDRHKRMPDYEEWLQFTQAYPRNANKNWTWVGPVAGLTQYRINTFFIDNRVIGLPKNAVRIAPPG